MNIKTLFNSLNNKSKYDLTPEHLVADKVMMGIVLAHAFVAIFVTSQYYETYSLGILSSGIILTITGFAYITLAGSLYFRLIIATALMFFSAIFIQQHLGRIEMHFHVFIALAILTIYKDLRPMLLASLVIIIHHFAFNYLQLLNFTIDGNPIMVFSYGCGIEYVILHGVFVASEALVLSYIIILSKNQFLNMKELQIEAQENQSKAISAEQIKSEFLANMSHEIRTPMNGIIGFTHLIQQTNLNDEQKRYLNTIESSTQTLLQIVNQILDFSKIESEKVELDLISVNPFEEFESALTIFVPIANKKEINFNIDIDPSICECIVVDLLKLKQVLTNLVSNAIKFTSSGGTVSIRIVNTATYEGMQRLKFSVSDTGIGIPKERQKIIFEAFTQVDSSTTRRFGGTGLGLKISASYVRLMGGNIQVNSIVGKGSTFEFELDVSKCNPSSPISSLYTKNELIVSKEVLAIYPMLVNQLKQLHLSYISVNSEEITSMLDSNEDKIILANETKYLDDWFQIQLKPKIILLGVTPIEKEFPSTVNFLENYDHSTSMLYNCLRKLNVLSGTIEEKNEKVKPIFDLYILVAEDYTINQMLIGEILKGYGIKFDIAENGNEAVEMALLNNYDLVLMDINMPEMNGIEATKKLREAFDDTLPIVALTANAAEGDRNYFISMGMDDYLSKPINPTELENVLKRFGNCQVIGKTHE